MEITVKLKTEDRIQAELIKGSLQALAENITSKNLQILAKKSRVNDINNKIPMLEKWI
jgi:hypothetical protein